MGDYNCNEFLIKCEGKTFKSIEELNEFMFDIELTTNTAYKIKDSSYFPKRTKEHSKLFFKHVRYVCSGSGNSGCVSYILIRATDNELVIMEYNMRHSHDLPSNSGSLQGKKQLLKFVERLQNPPAVIEEVCKPISTLPFDNTASDFTETFRTIFDRGTIHSLDDLYIRIGEFKRSTGSVYSLTRSGKFPENTPESQIFVYKTLHFQCKHSGLVKNANSRSRSSKINCPSKITFHFSGDRFVVGRFVVTHNHAVSQDYAEYYQENKKLTKEQRAEAELIMELDLNNRTIQQYLEKKFGRKFLLEEVRRMKYIAKRKRMASTKQEILLPKPDDNGKDYGFRPVAIPVSSHSQLQTALQHGNPDSVLPYSKLHINERRHKIMPILRRLEHTLVYSDVPTFHNMLGDIQDVLLKYKEFSEATPTTQNHPFSPTTMQLPQQNFQERVFHRH